MRRARISRAGGFGAADLIALILVVFVLWLAALRQFPKYASKAVSPSPPTPTAAPESTSPPPSASETPATEP